MVQDACLIVCGTKTSRSGTTKDPVVSGKSPQRLENVAVVDLRL